MRRLFIFTCFFIIPLSAQAAQPVPENGRLVFEILRDGQPFGMHTIAFHKTPDGKTIVNIDIEMKAALGPIVLFRYEHSNREVWRGDDILVVDSRTNDNGERHRVHAEWKEDRVVVEADGNVFEAPADLYPTSYWNPVMLTAKTFLNSQTGKLQDINVVPQGMDSMAVPQGSVQAEKYLIETDTNVHVWYHAASKQWADLAFAIRGHEITYRRLMPVPSDS